MSLLLQVDESLKPFNSFGVDVRASLYAEACSDDDVREALQCSAQRNLPLLVIGATDWSIWVASGISLVWLLVVMRWG